MTNYFAHPRSNRGNWLEKLLQDQSEASQTPREELNDVVTAAAGHPHALLAVDRPSPARGYALLLPHSAAEVLARVHVLEGQPDAVYQALFSAMIVQARNSRAMGLNTSAAKVTVDQTALAPHVRTAVERFGERYGVFLASSDSEPAESRPEPQAEVEEPQAELDDPQTVEVAEDEAAEQDAPSSEEDDDSSAPEQAVEEGYECFDCGSTFKSPQALGAHSRVHAED